MKNKVLASFLFFTFLLVILPQTVFAAESKKDVYCPLCQHRNSDDPLYNKERQFYQKVKILKEVYGNSLDEVALTFAVTDRYNGADKAFEKEYDKNFDANEYKKKNQFLKGSSVDNLTEEDIKLVKQNEKYDLLTLAAIVMVDSNKGGEYSDVCFMDGLAGKRLVANDSAGDVVWDDDDIIGSLIKFISSGFYSIVNGVTCNSVIQQGTDSYFGDSAAVRTTTENLRVENVGKVCEKGYIGGLYDIKGEDDEKYDLRKHVIAEGIIAKANHYRKLYGNESLSGNACAVGLDGNTQASDLIGKSIEERIQIIGPLAQAVYSQTGVFASVTIAQAIQESGIMSAYEPGGGYEWPSMFEQNNAFGIKCRSNYECKNGYAVYPSLEGGIADHAAVFANGSYPGWDSASSAEEQIRVVGPVYCPVSDGCGDYAGTIISVINSYDLKKWDVKTNVSNGSCIGVTSVSGWNIRKVAPTSSDSSFAEFEKSNGTSNRGQCVWYAKGRAFEILDSLKEKNSINESQSSNIKKLILSISGNGGDIYDNAKDKFNTSNDIKKPKAGSLIVWKKKGDYGHVAVVEEVNNESNTITVIGGYTSTGSCPTSWDCVKLETKTMSLDEFYNGYGKNYNGGYEFDGYVYFLEPKGDTSLSNITNTSNSSSSSNDSNAKYGSSKEYVCQNGKAVKRGSSCFGNVDLNSDEYKKRLEFLPNYYQGSGKAKDIPVNGAAFSGVGCGAASLMAAYYMYTGDDFDVNKFVDDAINQGYLSSNGSDSTLFYTPDGTKVITDNWGLYGERLDRNIDSIVEALKNGKKVLYNIYVNHDSNWPTNFGHYILFDHYNQSSDEIYIFDPNGSAGRNGYFKRDYVNRQLVVSNMHHDPVAISMNGSTGSCDSSSSNTSSVVECAKKQLGKEYVLATAGPDTFDCSGLTSYCYKEALGVDLSRSSYDQLSDDRFVNVDSIDKLKPGDIIVYRDGGHVAIYIGNGEIIHASRPGVGVIQSSATYSTDSVTYRHYKG